jgi:dipeptidyl aminopeptidase/acylaminoacyl peptidase
MDGDQLTRRNLTTGLTEPVGGPDIRHPWLTFDPNTDAPVTVHISEDDFTWLDKDLGGLHASLQKVFKGSQVYLYDWSADRERVVVRVDSADASPKWFLFDRPRKELSPLGVDYPALASVALGKLRRFKYKARDGLEIEALLTMPPGAPAANAKAPVVVLPHGGPQAQDGEGFDFIVQFLATRGYAVLQPQFRGSTGYGEAFRLAGQGEWGGKMQTDLLDAVAAAAANGDVDPLRTCIVGASFGGYAAMAGAAFHSESYRCAAAIAGVSDLGLLLGENVNLYGKDSAAQEQLRETLGQSTSQKLAATSPAQHAADVKIPLLLIHGDQDTVVPPEQSEVMAKAMKVANRPVEHVVLAGENHYLTKTATRTQMLKTLEAFLAKNLPVAQ